MSIDEMKALVMRFVDEPWNKGNVAVIDELCAPSYTVRYLTESSMDGREGIKQAILNYRAQSPDFIASVNEIIVEGDRVAYTWTMSGTMDGKYTKNVGITILRLKEGKIIEDRFLAGEVKEGTAVA